MWVRQDDSVTSHPKIAMAGPDAFILWSGGLCYANRHTTDGFIADHVLPMLFPAFGWTEAKCRPLAARLVKAGLWHPAEGGGWLIHDYSEYQDEAMRANVEKRREAAKLRKRAQRERDYPEERRGKSESHAVTARDESQPVTPVSQAPVPIRPDPSRSLSHESDGARARTPAPQSAFEERCRTLQAELRKAHKATRGDVMPPALGGEPSMQRDVSAIATWLAANPSVDVPSMCARWATAKGKDGRGWAPLSWLSNNPTEYLGDPRAPLPNSAYRDQAMTGEEFFGKVVSGG